MVAEVYAEDGYYAVIPEWVLDSDVSAQAIRLYAVLRRYADQRTMHAHPSRRTLAQRLQVADVKVVDRALADLKRVGAVSVLPRFTDDGDQSSNSYLLHRAPQGGGSNATPPKTAEGGGSNATGLGGQDPYPSPVSTPTVGAQTGDEPQPMNHSQEPQPEQADLFDRFWSAYPRKVGKVSARRAWTSVVRKAVAEDVVAAVATYPFSTEVRYVPHPASWLNGRRWEDDRAAVNPNTPERGAPYRDPTDPTAYHQPL